MDLHISNAMLEYTDIQPLGAEKFKSSMENRKNV